MTQRAPGTALVVAGVALASASALELSAGDRRGNGDDPADSLRYLAEYGDLYSYSGLAMVVGGVATVVGVLGVLRFLGMPSLAYATASVFGVLAGGFLAVNGVMRMQANGTVPHIQSLDQGWGESAYLVVQMAGTQGLMSTGMMALAVWLVALAALLVRRGARALALFAVLPAGMLLILLLDLALPALDDNLPEWMFLVYILCAIVGIPLACIGFGIALAVRRTQERLRPTPS